MRNCPLLACALHFDRIEHSERTTINSPVLTQCIKKSIYVGPLKWNFANKAFLVWDDINVAFKSEM